MTKIKLLIILKYFNSRYVVTYIYRKAKAHSAKKFLIYALLFPPLLTFSSVTADVIQRVWRPSYTLYYDPRTTRTTADIHSPDYSKEKTDMQVRINRYEILAYEKRHNIEKGKLRAMFKNNYILMYK